MKNFPLSNRGRAAFAAILLSLGLSSCGGTSSSPGTNGNGGGGIPGTLGITVAPTPLGVGGNGTVTVTLNGSANVSSFFVNLTANGANLSPAGCSVSSQSPVCTVTITGTSAGATSVNASANGYSASSAPFSIVSNYVFVAGTDQDSNNVIWTYNVNQSSGALTYAGESIAMPISGDIFVYNNVLYIGGDPTLYAYNIESTNGSLSFIESQSAPAACAPDTLDGNNYFFGLAFSNNYAYSVTDGGSCIYQYSVAADGSLVYTNESYIIANGNINEALATNPSTNTLYAGGYFLEQYAISPSGILSYTESYSYDFGGNDGFSRHNNYLYSAQYGVSPYVGNIFNYVINPDGSLSGGTESAPIPFGSASWVPSGYTFVNGFAYIGAQINNTNAIWYFTIESSTGALTSLDESAPLPTGVTAAWNPYSAVAYPNN